MAKRLLLALAFVACAAATGIANVPAGGHASTAAVLDRFLAVDAQPLVSYRAFRHLTASTRGGKMTASIEAWTSLDLEHGFSYDVTKSEGSSIIQSKVLLRALDTEKENAQSATSKAQSALTPANYEFLEISPLTDSTVRIDVRSRRKHVMLINGHLVVESNSADLVRVEGDLSKRPSFWTRHVNVVREYDRIGGVHVPISMKSTADVLIVGNSTFSMDYKYSEINGKPIS